MTEQTRHHLTPTHANSRQPRSSEDVQVISNELGEDMYSCIGLSLQPVLHHHHVLQLGDNFDLGLFQLVCTSYQVCSSLMPKTGRLGPPSIKYVTRYAVFEAGVEMEKSWSAMDDLLPRRMMGIICSPR